MASSRLRWIFRQSAAVNSPDYYCLMRGLKMINDGAPRRMMSVVSNGTSESRRISSPWLMLPPETVEGDINNDRIYKLYSLAGKKVVNFSSKSVGWAKGDAIKFISSSSHGWLAFFNRHNCDLFLFNPLSGRHIKLPPIHTLPIPKRNLRGGFGCVRKVIISGSPEQQDCRVMMSFGPPKRLAFCAPTSVEWTPIGAWYQMDERDDFRCARAYHDFVYSNTQKLFYCIRRSEYFEAWDLQDTGNPKFLKIRHPSVDGENYSWARSEKENELEKLCISYIYLVVEEESGDVFRVRRHVMDTMAPDGSYFDCSLDKTAGKLLRHKTIGFDVHKYDPKKHALVYMKDGSLDGLALFIGNNHSFALSASAFPELKPNSIYLTDIPDLIPTREPYGGHDVGIFNYEDQTFSPCCLPM